MQDSVPGGSGNSKLQDILNCSKDSGMAENNEPEIKQGEAEKVTSNEEDELRERSQKLGEVVIDTDVDNRSENDGHQGTEKVCRICHLNEESMETMQLGCDCKAELGVCHRHCADAWFNQRGNRLCEICGKTAKNIKPRIEESRIMVMEWNQRAVQPRSSYTSSSSVATQNASGIRCQQSCCNFLLACFVMAFTLPWFFRVNFP